MSSAEKAMFELHYSISEAKVTNEALVRSIYK